MPQACGGAEARSVVCRLCRGGHQTSPYDAVHAEKGEVFCYGNDPPAESMVWRGVPPNAPHGDARGMRPPVGRTGGHGGRGTRGHR